MINNTKALNLPGHRLPILTMKRPQSHKQTLMLNNKNKIHPNSDFQPQNDEQIEIPP